MGGGESYVAMSAKKERKHGGKKWEPGCSGVGVGGVRPFPVTLDKKKSVAGPGSRSAPRDVQPACGKGASQHLPIRDGGMATVCSENVHVGVLVATTNAPHCHTDVRTT